MATFEAFEHISDQVETQYSEEGDDNQYFETRYVVCPDAEDTQIAQDPGVSFHCVISFSFKQRSRVRFK